MRFAYTNFHLLFTIYSLTKFLFLYNKTANIQIIYKRFLMKFSNGTLLRQTFSQSKMTKYTKRKTKEKRRMRMVKSKERDEKGFANEC